MSTGGKRRWPIGVGIVLGAALAALVALELGLRVVGFEFHLYPEKLQFGYPDPTELEDYFLPHDEYLWVQRNYEERLRRAHEQKPYLVLSGCSCTEWGRFDRVLARLAREEPRVAPLRLANMACSGWSTYQGLRQLKRDVVGLAPKVVTIYYGWNDHWMGFGVEDKMAAELAGSTTLTLQKLRIVQLVTRARVTRQARAARIQGAGTRPERVSLTDFRENLEEMVAVARAHGITPVLITAPTTHRRGEEPEYLGSRWIEDLSRLVPLHQSYVDVVRSVAAEHDVVLCDMEAAFARLPREEALTLMKDDGIHFVSEGAALAGQVLFRCLVENGLLPTE